MIQARDGRLYGTQSGLSRPGQPTFYGSVFRVEANGTRTRLFEFGTDASNPTSELLETHDGSLYGTTEGSPPTPPPFSPPPTPPPSTQHGTIFRVDPVTGLFTTVYRFSGPMAPSHWAGCFKAPMVSSMGQPKPVAPSEPELSSRSTQRARSRRCTTLPTMTAPTRPPV